mgnify:CR=1 FL=1
MEPSKHYESIKFYIKRLAEIKGSLLKYKTEYYPERVRSLLISYKFTINKIITHSEIYLREEKNNWDKLEEVNKLLKQYKDFLTTL